MGDGFVGGAGGALATAIMFLLFIRSFITIYPFHLKDIPNETESSDSSSKPNCVGQDWCEGNDSLAYGEFGLENTNPIRVSGPHGMGYYVSYLSEVFSKSFSYHRLGSRSSENENIPKMIDIYEIFDENGFKYPTLYVCMYSYAPSSKIPDCFTFKDSRVGELKDRDYYGRGTYTYPNGDKYVGYWLEGKQDGQGTLTAGNGDKYVGDWQDGKQHGQGTYTYSNGNKYVGEIKNGKKHGQGTFIFAIGAKYVGEFHDNKFHGQGTMTWTDGNKYVGEYQNGKRHGQGTMTWADGNKYVGESKDDRIHGQGTYMFADGSKDVGTFENDVLNGYATTYYANGNIKQEGVFKDHEFLYELKKQ